MRLYKDKMNTRHSLGFISTKILDA